MKYHNFVYATGKKDFPCKLATAGAILEATILNEGAPTNALLLSACFQGGSHLQHTALVEDPKKQ